MKTRRRSIMAGTILLSAWLLTGGCVVYDPSYRYIDSYDRDSRPLLFAHLDDHSRPNGVPFLFEHIAARPPFDAEFTYYTHDIVDGAELVIERLSVRYPDGTETDRSNQLPGPLAAERYERWYVEDHEQRKTPSLRATWKVRECVTQKGAFTILVAGTLRQGDRELERFDAAMKCSPYMDTRLYTTWFWWFTLWAGASC